jgi:hypothetical protein
LAAAHNLEAAVEVHEQRPLAAKRAHEYAVVLPELLHRGVILFEVGEADVVGAALALDVHHELVARRLLVVRGVLVGAPEGLG